MAKQPNFLFFITDQQRADYLGCYGHPVLKTPHIDALAAQGTRFDRFFVTSPICMPNRAALLTGRYPSVNGVRSNGHALSVQANTFVEVLREAGYRTAHIGKSHLQPFTGRLPYKSIDRDTLGVISEAWKDDGGDYGQEEPERYASDSYYSFKTPFYGYDHVDMVTLHGDHAGGHYLQWLKQQRSDWQSLRSRENQLAHNYQCPQAYRTAIPEELYSTFYIRDRAQQFIESQKNSAAPFFAFVSFPDPHHPFTPPGQYWDKYSPADFSLRLPYSAHKNPPPPLLDAYQHWQNKHRPSHAQTAFMVDEQDIREAMALTCGMIAMIDDAIGSLINTLHATNLYDNTVLVFNADHGDYLGDYNLLLKGALPLRSITQVPFIWSDPEQRSGQVSNTLASTLDLAPTIIARAGLKPYWGIQGFDLNACIQNPHSAAAVRSAHMIEYHDGMSRMGFSEPAFVRSLVSDDYRFTVYKGEDWGELYDLRDDPNESYNRWHDPAYASIRSELSLLLLQHMMQAVEQSPLAKRVA